MFFFFELHLHFLPAHGTVFFTLKILPGNSSAVLTVQANRTDTVAGNPAGHHEDGALTTWHSSKSLMAERNERKAAENDAEAEDLEGNRLSGENLPRGKPRKKEQCHPSKEEDEKWLRIADNGYERDGSRFIGQDGQIRCSKKESDHDCVDAMKTDSLPSSGTEHLSSELRNNHADDKNTSFPRKEKPEEDRKNILSVLQCKILNEIKRDIERS